MSRSALLVRGACFCVIVGSVAGPSDARLLRAVWACCTGDVCTEMLEEECDTLGGVWLDGVNCPPANPTDPCALGACCVGPGDCNNEEPCDTWDECVNSCGGEFVGGVTCADNPCPVCTFGDEDHCQLDDPDNNSMYQADRSVGEGGARLAEDFIPLANDVITGLCFTAGFYNPYIPAECAASPPDDNWLIRFFTDAGGIPGTELEPIGGQTLETDDILARVRRSPTSRLYDYQAQFPTPVSVSAGQCYWMEISGYGTGVQGCRTYINSGGPANHYGFRDEHGDGQYDPDEFDTFDLEVCLHLESGITADGCGDFYGECCTCPAVCTPNLTAQECTGKDNEDPPGIEGIWHLGETCAPGEPLGCNLIPDNDNCENAEVVTGLTVKHCNGPLQIVCEVDQDCVDAGDGVSCREGLLVDFSNRCATDDGGGALTEGDCAGNGHRFHYDVWYSYTAEDSGVLGVTSCGLAQFDQMIAIYDGDAGCTPDNDIACGDDTCGIGAGPAEVSLFVSENQELLIRVPGGVAHGNSSR